MTADPTPDRHRFDFVWLVLYGLVIVALWGLAIWWWAS